MVVFQHSETCNSIVEMADVMATGVQMRVAYSQPHLCCEYVGENRSDIAMEFIIRHYKEVGANLRHVHSLDIFAFLTVLGTMTII